MSVRVLLADDHALLRSGLKMLLERDGFEVVGEASTGEESLEQTRKLKPDVVILDITMPGLSSAMVARRLKMGFPELKIVVLTMHESPSYLRTFLEIGADAYVVKRAADADLCAAIQAAMRGETYVHPSLSEHLVTPFLGRPKPGAPPEPELLTRREREVCRLIACGYTNREVGERLRISIRTVETHRSHILDKLGLSSRAELVRFASTHGLLDPEGPP